MVAVRPVAVNGGETAGVSAKPRNGGEEWGAAEGWLMPGLIDTRSHFHDVCAVSDDASMRPFEQDEPAGRRGLFPPPPSTAITSAGDPTDGTLRTRARTASGALRGPRLLAAGCGVTGRAGHPERTQRR